MKTLLFVLVTLATISAFAESPDALPDASAVADSEVMQGAIDNARLRLQQANPGEVERAEAYQQAQRQPNLNATQSISNCQQYETDMEKYGPNAPAQ